MYFTLPCYKVNELGRQEEVQVSTVAAPSLTAALWHQVSQISPEPQRDEEGVETNPADKFSGIAQRPLQRPGQCKVLVVDDSNMNNKILAKIIKRIPIECADYLPDDVESYSVGLRDRNCNFLDFSTVPQAVYVIDEAEDGTTAVEKVQEAIAEGSPFDIVFMDNTMIRMNGPEAAQLMRSSGYSGLIVGVTGNVMAQDVSEYIASGADCVLGKPVNFEELGHIFLKFK